MDMVDPGRYKGALRMAALFSVKSSKRSRVDHIDDHVSFGLPASPQSAEALTLEQHGFRDGQEKIWRCGR